MMVPRCFAAFVAFALLEAGGPDGIQVSTLVRDGHVYVSYVLAEQVMQEAEETIQAGLPTTFSYEVEMRRSVTAWLDRTLASATVTASVQYDTLTGRHQLSRTVDGRLEDSRVSESRPDVRRYLTQFERLPLFDTATLDTNAEYYVRVRVRTRPRVAWFFWPWDRGLASGRARFTFIP
jgi:hypothetical protein